MRVLIAPDSFKGTLRAAAVAEAMAGAVEDLGHRADRCPLADGGEGTLDALGGANKTSTVTGPLGDPVEARWRLDGRRAVIEMAEASGLELVGGPEANDPIAASTTGTGELIEIAMQRGANEIVVAAGGSATTDGGWGAVQALYPAQRLRGVDLVVACDVRTTFVDAAETFAPQKGASPAQVELLRRRLIRLVQVYKSERGVDVSELVGGGAAGGLAGGLAALGADLVPGFEVVADSLDLFDAVQGADAVITGEGRVDSTSFEGKVVGGVHALADELGVPVLTVAGSAASDLQIDVMTLEDVVGADRARTDTAAAIRQATTDLLHGWSSPLES